jgi:hypothetical protein
MFLARIKQDIALALSLDRTAIMALVSLRLGTQALVKRFTIF